MKILLDTNIIVDIIDKERNILFPESLLVLKNIEASKIEGYITTNAVMNIMYILRKQNEEAVVSKAIFTLLQICDLIDVKGKDIRTAFDSEMTDYDDAVQSKCAQRKDIDYIVTRNIKHFEKSEVPVLTPKEFLFKVGKISNS